MPASDFAGTANSTSAEILAKLGTDPKTGLNSAQLQERLSKYGPNALAEEKKSALSAFLAYFWGPHPMDDRGRRPDGVYRKRLGRFHYHRVTPVI
jgi:magnesium-transporting ATPase (P-type)